VEVASVTGHGPAAKAGLKIGDIIIKIDAKYNPRIKAIVAYIGRDKKPGATKRAE